MQSVLDQVDSPELRVYVVWEPILITDRERAARRATAFVRDRRADHYWSPDLELAHAFRGPLGLEREAAWDVYLVFDRAARWGADAVPTPIDFQHQLSGRLPENKFLDEPALVARIRSLLGSGAGFAK